MWFSIFSAVNVLCEDKSVRSPTSPFFSPVFTVNATAVYNAQTEICCKGKVTPATSHDKCCEDKPYDSTKQLCCIDQVKPLLPNYACCGWDSYNTQTQVCCNGLSVISSSEPITPSTACCGNRSYDWTKQKCCSQPDQSMVYDMKPNVACCGVDVYNRETELCCRNYDTGTFYLYPKKSNSMLCCNGKAINSNVQGCCHEIPYNLKENACCYTMANYSSAHYDLVPNTDKGLQCCGAAKKMYNPKTQICCGSTVTDNPDRKLLCCNVEPYNMETEFCCSTNNGSKTVQLTSRDDNVCCGYTTFNINKQSCCSDGDSKYTIYSRTNSICCNGEVHKMQSNLDCCGSKTFNTKNQMCCDGTVADISVSMQKCCGEKTYNAETETCCQTLNMLTGKYNYTVIHEHDPNKKCCGYQLFSSDGSKECCDNKVYNMNDEICCGRNIFSKGNDKSKNRCCYPFSTDDMPPLWFNP